MTELPWNLTFDTVAGLTTRYDPVSGRLDATFTNTTADPLTPGDLVLRARPNLPLAAAWAWLQGRFMQTDALVRNFGEPDADGYDNRSIRLGGTSRTYVSREMVTLNLPTRSAPTLLIGCLRMDRFFFDVEVEVDLAEERLLELRLVFNLEGTSIAPGASLHLPPFVIREGSDANAMAHLYAESVATEMHARVPGHVPTGWCSWYYYYDRVCEEDIVSNLEQMKATSHPAEYLQIDDGYQSFTGDWLVPNAKFPSGMAAVAASIRAAGYKPGLWLAPLILHEGSVALREHPDMVLKTHAGETVFVHTWLGRSAILDCSHPQAEAWLRNTVRGVVREWGYEYLKLDALSFAACSSAEVRYHVPDTTGPSNLRRGLEIIREEAGDSTFILGCTCHFGPAIGFVDGMRVGPDVKELWEDGPKPSVKHAMRLTLQRNWMHNHWWANDPDCLMVREDNTELSDAETRFLATAIVMSGGMVVASDDLQKLPDARQRLALALFPPVGIAADPETVGEGPVSASWRVTLGEGRFLVGILNWFDTPQWVTVAEHLRPGEIAFDAWSARLIGKGDILLRPHEGTLWQVTGAGKTPRVVGDSAHINYHGLFQRQVSGRIQVRNDRARSRILAIEARGQVVEVSLEPGEMRWFD